MKLKTFLFYVAILFWMIGCMSEQEKQKNQVICSFNCSDNILEVFVTKSMLIGCSLENYCAAVYPMYAYGELIFSTDAEIYVNEYYSYIDNVYAIRLSNRQTLKTWAFNSDAKDTSHIYTIVWCPRSFHNDGD